MNIRITKQEKKPMLSREEVIADVEFTGISTPSRDKIKAELVKTLGKDAKLVVVKLIDTKFGSASAKVTVYVYDNEKDMKLIEPKVKVKVDPAAPKAEGA
jgi:ribosomal protein S24E